MRFPGFIGPSYTLSSRNVDCQRCINLIPEVNEIGRGKEQEVMSLISTPGLLLKATIGSGPIRGTHFSSDGQLFVVSGNKLYTVTSGMVATERGTLTTSSGPVSMADNGTTFVVVDGTVNAYKVVLATLAFSAITFPSDIGGVTFAGVDTVAFQDGYFLMNLKGTGKFFITGLNDTTIDPLDFATAEGSPDLLLGLLCDHREVWLFGVGSIEVFYNSGNADFPFERMQGAFIEKGIAAIFSFEKVEDTVFWLGRDRAGQGIVYKAQGYQPQPISTRAVELAIQSYGDISDATAYTYQQNGHTYYVLNFPSANTTWVYDITTGLWHERVYTYQGEFQRHRANNHVFAFGMHLVGDYENGKLYELSTSTYSDDGAPISRQRVTPHVTSELARLFYHKFQLDLEMGVGLDGAGQGTDPQVMLRYSDDGGHSWSNEKWASIGKIGERTKRAIWRRLGQSRDRVFEITITDPVKVVMIGADLDVERAAS
jgi:hypothetical protein